MIFQINSIYILKILIISVFLPSVFFIFPIRFDQLLIFFFGFLTLFSFFVKWKVPRDGSLFFVCLLILVIIALLPLFLIEEKNLQMLQERSLIYVISDVERLIRVAMIILISASVLQSQNSIDIDKLKSSCINLFLLLLSINSLLILYIAVSNNLPNFLLDFYWLTTQESLDETVAGRSYLNSRITGIFLQPMESGFAYGLGFLLLLYKNKFSFIFGFNKLILLIFIFIGGILSISKVFFVGVFFITILILFLKLQKFIINIITLFILSLISFYIFSFVTFEDWNGLNNYSILFDMIFSFDIKLIVDALSAGRFANPESPLTQMIDQVSKYSPYLGFGAGSFAANEVPVDSGYMLFYYQTGIIGFSIFVFLIILLVINQSINIIKAPNDDNYFIYVLLLYIISASIGSPVLFLNRSGTILWIFIMIFLVHENKKKSQNKITK